VPQRENLNVATDLGHSDSLLLRATEKIGRGHIIVMDMQGCRHVGGIGDVLTARFIDAGAAGVVADGGMRDVSDLRTMGLPIFCAGPAAPPGPMAIMPVGVQQPVGCRGVVIFPGDYVVGDEDGVVVVSSHLGIEVGEQCIAKEKQDAWSRSQVEAGGGLRGRYPPDAAHLEMYKGLDSKQKVSCRGDGTEEVLHA
jgi:regulator of RNase E activity RraA